MEWIFGPKKTPKEILREQQRVLKKAMRDIDREKASLQNQEKKTLLEIKQLAKQGQMPAARIMAKDIVRTRNYVTRFTKMRTQLQAVSLRMQTLQSTQAMAEAMRGVTKAMKTMNRQMNMPAMQKIMMEFERETGMMDLKEEMMSDTIDDVMEGENDEQEEEELINSIFDEIGMGLTTQLKDVPRTEAVAEKAKEASLEQEDIDLQARLENLRKT